MKNLLKKLFVIILIVLIIAAAVGIGFLIFRAVKSVDHNKNAKNPVLTLDVEGYGEVKIELEPDYAPNTVATIIKLAQNGYYDGKVFYGTDTRAVTAGMSLTEEEVEAEEGEDTTTEQPEGETATPATTKVAKEEPLKASDLNKNIKEADDYEISIPGEFVAADFEDNTIRFEKGTVGLYRSNYAGTGLEAESYNSGKALFFISTDEDSTLNGQYAAFGKVIEGMDLIEKMLSLPLEQTDSEDTSSDETGTLSDNQKINKFAVDSLPVITKATVETYGVDYGMPEYQEAFDYNQYMSDLIMQYYYNNQ